VRGDQGEKEEVLRRRLHHLVFHLHPAIEEVWELRPRTTNEEMWAALERSAMSFLPSQGAVPLSKKLSAVEHEWRSRMPQIEAESARCANWDRHPRMVRPQRSSIIVRIGTYYSTQLSSYNRLGSIRILKL
jgi:hypothetical protein